MDLHLSFWQCYHEAGVHASTETTQKAIQSVPLQISHWSPKKKKNNIWTRGVKNEEEFEIWRWFKLSKIASSQKLDLPSFHSPPYPAKKKQKKFISVLEEIWPLEVGVAVVKRQTSGWFSYHFFIKKDTVGQYTRLCVQQTKSLLSATRCSWQATHLDVCYHR